MEVAYEHVRMVSTGGLKRELIANKVDDELPDTELEYGARDHNEIQGGSLRDVPQPDLLTDDSMGDSDMKDMLDTLMRCETVGEPVKDLGAMKKTTTSEIYGRELERSEQSVMESMFPVLGSTQVSKKKMEFAPPWIVEE